MQFRIATVTRRSKFRLTQVERRIHILEGRIIVLLNIDKVIKVIRDSDEPKPDLMKQFKLTEMQAEDILEIRLRQLARLEGIKIETELKELKDERKDLKGLLGSDAEMKKLVAEEIRDDAKTLRRCPPHADRGGRAARRSSARSSTSRSPIIVSRNGWVRARPGHGLDLSGITYKTGDGPYAIFETRSVHSVGDHRLHRPRVQRARLPSSPAARATARRSPRSSSSRPARGSRTSWTRSRASAISSRTPAATASS